ncbi:MAG: N-acetylmuramoyl-L-alanine amidase [Chloroflexi bacterium]|nr:N-acetylmuramoyl-L-alanine amidase [Chloroflexota bacterium]
MPDIIDIIEKLPRKPDDPNWRSRALGAITKIVVHYDAVPVPAPHGGSIGYDPVARYTEQANYHIQKNWNESGGPPVHGFGLMYHYRVSADGRLWRTQPETLITWHARAANTSGLAVCCDLGPGQDVTAAQTAGLKMLLDWLCHHRPDIPAARADVWGHGELHKAGNQTSCPGNLLDWVQAYRRGSPSS